MKKISASANYTLAKTPLNPKLKGLWSPLVGLNEENNQMIEQKLAIQIQILDSLQDGISYQEFQPSTFRDLQTGGKGELFTSHCFAQDRLRRRRRHRRRRRRRHHRHRRRRQRSCHNRRRLQT